MAPASREPPALPSGRRARLYDGGLVNLLDIVLITVILVSAINGYRRGAALQLTVYAGLLGGLLIGALLAPPIARLFDTPLTQAVAAMVVLIAAAAIGDGIGWAIGTRFWVMARRSAFGAVDSIAGSFVAAVAVVLATWFVALNLVAGPIPPLSRQIRGSAIVRGLDTVLPPPPPLLAQVRRVLNTFGFPEVFADVPPPPAGPVQGPSEGEARDAALAADQSTVRIVGSGCGGVQEGSGFVAAPNYVVTNAHVVAGIRAPEVQRQNGPSFPATAVLFDPGLDIAVLFVAESPAPALELDGDVQDRGASGAVLGYPGGGPLQFGSAAVRQQIDAVGRDIYGRSRVRREVYELQARVRPGNSGGPFVLADGTVAGVVFAASTTDPGIGYAIVSSEVMPLVEEARGRTEGTSTDGCAR